jgi:hypothetical protein
MHSRRKSLAMSAKGRQMARARWFADRARRDAEEPARTREMELARIFGEGPVEPGQYVGTLQWHGADGKVRRWTLRRGTRSGQIEIDGLARAKTTTWLLDRLRRHLAVYFRTGRGY